MVASPDTGRPENGVSNWIVIILLILFAGSLLGNVVQGWDYREVVSDLQISASNNNGHVGRTVLQLKVQSLSGDQETLNLTGKQSTIIYIFRPGCHWCARNLDNIKSLVRQRGDSFRVIGLSVDGNNLVDYVNQNALPFTVFVDSPADATSKLGFAGTPQTLVISPGGKIDHDWSGAYDGKLKEDIESYFGVKLPGLS